MTDENDLKIKPDVNRLADLMTVDQYFQLRENDPVSIVDLLSQFIVDDTGQYLSQEEGRKVIGKVKFSSIGALFSRFMSETEAIAIPFPKSKG